MQKNSKETMKLHTHLKKAIIDLDGFKNELNFMKVAWSENFHSQLLETQNKVRSLAKDCETIQSMAENIVVKRELFDIHKKLDQTVSKD